tara:strand:- start:878 stop:1627 length:750 start_codon:yes stop_codon:yes gene_type:complete
MNDSVQDLLNNDVEWSQQSSLFPRHPRLPFFNVMFKNPTWENKKILDIGGNNGNFLKDGVSASIKPSDYYCLDVDKKSLEDGKQNFPDANWIHHNAFNHMYNPTGTENTLFPFEDNTFDYVLAYSVYSHTTFEQFVFDLAEIKRVCKPGGQIGLTFVDKDSAEYFTKKRVQDYPNKNCLSHKDILMCDINDFKYFVDNDLLLDHLFGKTPVNHLVTIYNVEWLKEYLHNVEIKYPISGHVQKTAVIVNE